MGTKRRDATAGLAGVTRGRRRRHDRQFRDHNDLRRKHIRQSIATYAFSQPFSVLLFLSAAMFYPSQPIAIPSLLPPMKTKCMRLLSHVSGFIARLVLTMSSSLVELL